MPTPTRSRWFTLRRLALVAPLLAVLGPDGTLHVTDARGVYRLPPTVLADH